MTISQTINKFGRNPNIGTTTDPEDVWYGGGLYMGHPTGTPETINIVSDSTDDNGVTPGTGARTIRIYGLKTATSTDYEMEDFILNGTTTVTSATTWYRVNKAFILTAGTGGENAGNITCNHTTTTTTVFFVMAPLYNASTLGVWTVPFDSTAFLNRVYLSITRASGSSGSATMSIRVRDSITGVFVAKEVIDVTTSQAYNMDFRENQIVLHSGSDVKITVDSVSDNLTIANCLLQFRWK